jgi:membrane protease YdiL (CAAX protease family)
MPQYSMRKVLSVWAAATVPMIVLSWVVAPTLAGTLSGPAPLPRALILCMTAGLVWQGVLVLALTWRETRSLRWERVRDALWLRPPSSPSSGRVGGRLWWVLVPAIAIFGLTQLLPSVKAPSGRDLGVFLESADGQHFLAGNWAWLAIIVVLAVFNTVLGEELLFRGLLLPRMRGAFGKKDWLANGVLFALYHLDMPWAIPAMLLNTFALSYPARRYRSAWLGIIVHSVQSVIILVGTIVAVLR